MKDKSNYNTVNMLNSVKELPFFTIAQIKNLLGDDKNVFFNLSRWENKGYVIRLKKGLYTTKIFLDSTDRMLFMEFIANKLINNSYLSGTYILGKYGILTEIADTFTSITTNLPRQINNKLGKYSYNNIKDDLFCDFISSKYLDDFIYYAPVYKALFDYFYFRKSTFIFSDDYVNSLRFNWGNITDEEMNKFIKFCELKNLVKMTKIAKYLILHKNNHVN